MVPDALQDVPTPEATETDSEPDPAPTPLTVKTFFAEIKTFRPESDCDREWVRYTSAIEQSADRDLAQRDDELGAKFREFMASSNPMDQQIAATLRVGAALDLWSSSIVGECNMQLGERCARCLRGGIDAQIV